MYDELSTQSANYRARPVSDTPAQDPVNRFARIVGQVLAIEFQELTSSEPFVLVYAGKLTMDSALAYDVLEQNLTPMGYRAQTTTDDEGRHVIMILQGLFDVKPRPWWPNALMFGLTILSVMLAGSGQEGYPAQLEKLGILKGLPYAVAILLILGAHELGHYFAARYHKVAVTLPYFFPFPPPLGLFGTMGAFIQLRQPMRNRNQLFDIGAAGPLAGLVFAIPILFLGIATSDVRIVHDVCPPGVACIVEGNSAFYALSKFIFHGQWLPSATKDIFINQLAFAGWTGLFITGLNLLPIGQLDGGHIVYSLFGKWVKRAYYPTIGLLILLVIHNPGWIALVFLLIIFGRVHAVPQDDITPLGPRRRIVGYAALVIFLLIFVPSPIRIINM